MILVELLDERGSFYVVNMDQVAELEPAGVNRVRVYMASHTCRAHGVVMVATIQEIGEIVADFYNETTTPILSQTQAVIQRYEELQGSAVAEEA